MDGNKLNRVIFTCGGTAGHINPALALAQLMKEQNPEKNLMYRKDLHTQQSLNLISRVGYEILLSQKTEPQSSHV